MLTFYDIIGANENSSVEDIKKAYFNYLRKIHPDKQQSECDPTAVSQATLIWNTLKVSSILQFPESFVKDCKRRKEYDYWLTEQRLREQKGTVSEQIEIDKEVTELEEFCRCGDSFLISPSDIQQIVDTALFECGSCSLCLEVQRITEE